MARGGTRKYRNRPTWVGDQLFDSQFEADRFQELRLLMMGGHIAQLQTQVKFVLIERVKVGKRVFRAYHYIADFVYREEGQIVIEDTKGMRTAVFNLKWALMERMVLDGRLSALYDGLSVRLFVNQK